MERNWTDQAEASSLQVTVRGKKRTIATPLAPFVLDFIDHQRVGGASDSTIANYRSALGSLAEWSPETTVADLDGHDGERLLVRFLQTKGDTSPANQRRIHSHLATFTKYLARREIIARDPMLGIAKPKRPPAKPSPLTDAQVDALFAACTGPRDRLALLLMVVLGLRKMEVARLRLGQIDCEAGYVTFTGKRGKPARLPITEEIRLAVEAVILHDQAEPSEFVLYPVRHSNLPGREGEIHMREKPLSATAMHAWWRRLATAADLPATINLHRLRHTAGTRLYRASHDAQTTQHIMRHSNIATTFEYYVEADDAAMVSALEAVSRRHA